eukprot:2244348-Rhodomonas_salina.1
MIDTLLKGLSGAAACVNSLSIVPSASPSPPLPFPAPPFSPAPAPAPAPAPLSPAPPAPPLLFCPPAIFTCAAATLSPCHSTPPRNQRHTTTFAVHSVPGMC